jgi:hypothetical protein
MPNDIRNTLQYIGEDLLEQLVKADVGLQAERRNEREDDEGAVKSFLPISVADLACHRPASTMARTEARRLINQMDEHQAAEYLALLNIGRKSAQPHELHSETAACFNEMVPRGYLYDKTGLGILPAAIKMLGLAPTRVA